MRTSVMIAFFVSPNRMKVLPIVGDENEQNVGDALKEEYGEWVENLATEPCWKEGEVVEITHGVYMSKCDEGTTKAQATRLAGFMGFERDWVREDSFYGVLYFDPNDTCDGEYEEDDE